MAQINYFTSSNVLLKSFQFKLFITQFTSRNTSSRCSQPELTSIYVTNSFSCSEVVFCRALLFRFRPGGANYESKGGAPLPRVGARSHGWDPNHKGRTPLPRVGPRSLGQDPAPQGRTPLPRVGHFQKNHCISIQNTKKRKNLYRAMPCNSKGCQLSIDINYLSFDCMV